MTPKERFDANQGLIGWCLRRHRLIACRLHPDDARATVAMAFWQACLLFDESSGYRFSTYVFHATRNELLKARALDRTIYVPLSAFRSSGTEADALATLRRGMSRKHVVRSYDPPIDESERIFGLVRKHLSPTDARTFSMHVNGESNVTIASLLGVTKQAVDQRLDRIKRRLRVLIKKERVT